MLDRDVIEKFLDCELEDMEIPEDIDKRALVEAFASTPRMTLTNG